MSPKRQSNGSAKLRPETHPTTSNTVHTLVEQQRNAALTDYLLDSRTAGHSPDTLRLRRQVLRQLQQELGPLPDVTEDQLVRWYRRYDAHSLNTRVAYGRAVASFYRWAVRRHLVETSPAVALPVPRARRGVPRPIPVDDLHHALRQAPDVRMRLWLLLAAGGGLRAGEIARLRREDLHRQDGIPVLAIAGKGDKPRSLVIPEPLAHQLELYRTSPGRFWPVTPGRVSNAANQYLHSLGIVHTLHTCRHAFGTTYYQASRDLLATAEALGHSQLTTTAGYAAVSPAAHVEALTAVEVLLGWHEAA